MGMNIERNLSSTTDAAFSPLRFTLSDAEHHEVHALATRLLQRQLLKGSFFSATLRICLLALVVFGVATFVSASLPTAWGNLLALAAGVALLGGLIWRQQTRLRQISRERLGDDFVVMLSDVGLRVGAALGLTTYVWSALQKAEIEGAFVWVHLRGAMVLPIPLRAFAGQASTPAEAASVFVNTINARIQATGVRPQGTAALTASMHQPQSTLRTPTPLTFARALGRNVRAGVELALLRSRGLTLVQSNLSQFLALLILATLVGLVMDFIAVGRDGQFQWLGLRAVLILAVVCVTTAWAATVWTPASANEFKTVPLQSVVALATLNLVFEVLTELYEADAHGNWVKQWLHPFLNAERAEQWFTWWSGFAPWALWLWFALATAVTMARQVQAYGTHGARKFGAGVSALVAVTLMTWALGRSAPLWIANVDPAEAAERAAQWQNTATEAVLYRQPLLLQEALQAIEAGEPGQPELYYIGLAGAGYQDVFVNEVESVEKLLQQHFGAQGHGVLLANAMRTPLTRPFASVTALAKTLETVAQRMNVDEDVLFLFMTSHGSRQHEFQIELWPYRFESITPQRLRELLDASGIRHRVIVVSACYSGGFVPALKDDDTLVITAARADRTSFGCEDGRDWTAFGQAYFAEALTAHPSFEQAFQLATAKIAARERQENRTPSEPQIAVGAKIREQLRLIEPTSPKPEPETSP